MLCKMKNLIKYKQGDIDKDQLVYIILGVIALILLVAIVMYIFGDPMDDTGDKISGAFKIFS